MSLRSHYCFTIYPTSLLQEFRNRVKAVEIQRQLEIDRNKNSSSTNGTMNITPDMMSNYSPLPTKGSSSGSSSYSESDLEYHDSDGHSSSNGMHNNGGSNGSSSNGYSNGSNDRIYNNYNENNNSSCSSNIIIDNNSGIKNIGLGESKIKYIRHMVYQYLSCKDPIVKPHIESALIALFRYNEIEKNAIDEQRRSDTEDTITSITNYLSIFTS